METVKIEINLTIEVEVKGKYYKGSDGTFYKSNGDVGDPPEPAEFEIREILWQGKDITEMLDKENFDFQSLELDCIEKIEM